MPLLYLFSLGLFGYIFLCYVTKSGFFDKTISMEVNGKEYKVLEEMQNKEVSADLLSKVDSSIVKLLSHMEKKYNLETLSVLPSKKKEIIEQMVRRLKSTYSYKSLKENYPEKRTVDVSYNLNKGSTIALCLRNYDTPEVFHQYNEILFVALHELAHSLNCNESSLMCGDSYGHDDMFWYIFKILLEEAEQSGIYVKKNYKKDPVNYCSMEISYSPLYDRSLHDNHFLK